jgi:probable HAF family extracellular repeat protein
MRKSTTLGLLLIVLIIWTCCPVSNSVGTEPNPSVRYAIVDLGTLGGYLSFATAINDHGDVVGNSRTKSGQMHGFLWTNRKMRDLGTLGGPGSSASGINDLRAIVGQSRIGPGAGTSRAYLWIDGRMTKLSTSNHRNSSAVSINNAGVIVGLYTSEEGYIYGCYWDALGMHQLGGQTRNGASVGPIDDQGNIVGAVVRMPSPRFSDACIWRQGQLTLLPVPRATVWSVATAINKSGLIVGWVEDAQRHRPCMWQTSKRTVIQLLSASSGEARSINDSGMIVGDIGTGDKSRAVAWQDGRLIDLNNTIAQSEDWILEAASGINARGQIVGWGKHKGHKRGFLLTPVRQ